jgi:hypothetical protein
MKTAKLKRISSHVKRGMCSLMNVPVVASKSGELERMSALGRNRVLRRTWLVWTLACCFLQWLA